MAIENIGAASVLPFGPAATSGQGTAAPSAGGGAATGGFGESLHGLLSQVDGLTANANDAVVDMLGGTGDVHAAMIALQKAEIAMQFTVQLRNKFVQAYQDVMRMPI